MKLTMHGTPADFYIYNPEYRDHSKWIKGHSDLYYKIRNAKKVEQQQIMLEVWEAHKK